MRLIDADLLKKNCKCTGKFEDNFKGVDLIELAKVIDAQPTAYDVDKVVEELKSLQDEKTVGSHKIMIKEAIEIVKQGGMADGVCEWKPGKVNNDWRPSCEPNSTYNVFGVAWFRKCPYCGKKIKVVDL